MRIRDALAYEIHSSWWARHISWNWAQKLAGSYFAWKVKRKWRRYQASIAAAKELGFIKADAGADYEAVGNTWQ